jgi:outer membrane protein W
MKKLSLLIGGLLFSGLMFAQSEEQKGKITLEGQTNVVGVVIGEKLAPSLRFRYFATERLALRGTFGLRNSTETSTFTSLPNNAGTTGTYIEKSSAWNVAVGAEYHVTGTEKISPYVALDFVYGSGKRILDQENAISTAYQADFKRDAELPLVRFGVALMGGLDYNISSAFYLGGEVGFQISALTVGVGEATTISNGITVESSTLEKKFSSASDLIGAVRLGFRF